MRNVLVVLVLSCIGLSCGFIVPSGIREVVQTSFKSKGFITKLQFKRSNSIERKTPTDNPNLETYTTPITNKKNDSSSNNTLDKDLYEINDEKEGNIKERSFVYKQQKFKKPYIKNAFEVMHKNNKTYINNKNKGDISNIFPLSFLNKISKKNYAAGNEIINESTFDMGNNEEAGYKAMSIENSKLALKEAIREDYIDEIIRVLLGEQFTPTKRKFLERKINLCYECGKNKKMESFQYTQPIDKMCICRLKKSNKAEKIIKNFTNW